MTRVWIIPEENLDEGWERGFKRLAEKIRIKYPQHRYRTVEQLSPEAEFSVNGKIYEISENSRMVY